MTATEIATETAAAHDEHGDGHHDHPSDRDYVGIAIGLAILTLIEVGTFWPFGETFEAHPNLMILMLSVIMVIKFVIVVTYFMHLKFDSKVYSWMFGAGLVLAVGVYFIVFFAEGLF